MTETPDASIFLFDQDHEIQRSAKIKVYAATLSVAMLRQVDADEDWREYTREEPATWSDERSISFASGRDLRAFVLSLVEALTDNCFDLYNDKGEVLSGEDAVAAYCEASLAAVSDSATSETGEASVDPSVVDSWAIYDAPESADNGGEAQTSSGGIKYKDGQEIMLGDRLRDSDGVEGVVVGLFKDGQFADERAESEAEDCYMDGEDALLVFVERFKTDPYVPYDEGSGELTLVARASD